jgi:hypothetical protein
MRHHINLPELKDTGLLCHKSIKARTETLFHYVTRVLAWIETRYFFASPNTSLELKHFLWLRLYSTLPEPKHFVSLCHYSFCLNWRSLLYHIITVHCVNWNALICCVNNTVHLPGLKNYSQIIFKWLNWGSQVLFHFCYQGDQIDDNELAGACSTHGRMAEKRSAHNSVVTRRKDRDHIGNIGLDGTVVFKWILSNLSWGYELDSPGLGSRLLAGSCEQENEKKKKKKKVSWQLAQILSFWLQNIP